MNKFDLFKERIKKNFSENKVLFFVCIAIWIVLVLTTLLFYKTSLGMDSVGPEDYSNVVEVNENNKIIQILSVEDETSSFGLYFASYRRNNSGKVNIKIIGNDSNIVYLDSETNVIFLQDNAFHMYKLSEALNSNKDRNITIEISSNSKKDKAFGIYYGNGKYNQNDILTINGKNIDGTIVYRFMVKDNILKQFNDIVVIISITAISLLMIWLLLYKPKLEYFFAVLVLIIGLIFMAIMSPSSPPDETIHYENTMQESNYLMFNDDVYDVDSQFVDYVANNYYVKTKNDKNAYRELINNLNSDYTEGENADYYDVSIDDAYKIAYIPQSIGVVIARLFKVNPIKVFYSGRLTNLLFYVLCIFVCIKMTPIHKTLFGILASLPIFIQQASSYSYDTFINGLCFLTLGCLMKMKYGSDKIETKDYIIAFITCLLLAPAKYIYGFFALLFWLVPTEKYGSKQKKIIFTLLLNGPMLYQLLPIFVPRIIYILEHSIPVFAETNEIVKVEQQPLITMKYVVNNPIEVLSIIVSTIRYNLRSWFFESMGKFLSQLTLILPATIARLIVVIVIVAVFIEENIILDIKTRLSFIGICIVIAMFSIGGMLFSETHVGDKYISGIQGRYFSPILPYFFVSFTNGKINIPRKLNIYVIFAYILIIFEVIIYILSYTFVN